MGTRDYRLNKVRTLEAASRGIVLGRTQHLREKDSGPSFRAYRKQEEARRNLEVNWNKKQQEAFSKDVDKVQQVALGKERKRLEMMEKLKEKKGPFTNAEEVEEYMKMDLPDKVKQARLKMEMQFARDSSTTLPRVDPLFRIRVGVSGEKRKQRDKTPAEFAESLMVYLGRKGDRTVMEYETFKRSLRAL